MADKSIIGTVKSYLANLESAGIHNCYAVLFGSYAEGCQNVWSDIDVLIVSPRFDVGLKREDVNLLWRIAARTDSRIEPIPVGTCQFEEDDSSSIIETARRHGQQIVSAA